MTGWSGAVGSVVAQVGATPDSGFPGSDLAQDVSNWLTWPGLPVRLSPGWLRRSRTSFRGWRDVSDQGSGSIDRVRRCSRSASVAHDGRDRVRRSLRNDSGPRPAGHPSAETNNSVPASKATRL